MTGPVVFVMGPTAVGKSEVALALARHIDGEIVTVDSAQVYRGLDIGTAKPDAHLRRQCRHHLLDLRDPATPYSAAEFVVDARAAIAEIQQRGRTPLLAGGTGLYFRALERGLSPMPAADSAVRAELEAEAATHGLAALHERLRRLDPQTANRLHPHDAQRIQRALEVERLTGRPLSEVQRSPGVPGLATPPVKLILEPPTREWLHRRIEERFRAMLAGGLVDEVVALRRRAELSLELPAVRAVGYRQVWLYLEGVYDYPTLVREGVAATRQYAKRQQTWLRREEGAVRLAAGPGAESRACRALFAALRAVGHEAV